MQMVPEEQRYSELPRLLREYSELVHSIRMRRPDLAQSSPFFFYALTSAWVLPPSEGVNESTRSELAKKLSSEVGFDGERIERDLKEMLSRDKQLRECCRSTAALSHFLDSSYIRTAADLIAEGATDRLDNLFDAFCKQTYGSQFARISYSHLFNFDMDDDCKEFGPIRIEKVDGDTLASLLGEPHVPGAASFLQPRNVGSFFVVLKEFGGVDNEAEWFKTQHVLASNLVRAIQYAISGVTYVDYSVPRYEPEWCNQYHRFGLFYFGQPRQLPYAQGARMVKLGPDNSERVKKFVTAYTSPKLAQLIKDEDSVFRQASLRAGDYFESSLRYENPVERLVALSIALEALFSPGDGHEISFRIAQTASQMLGRNPQEKCQVFSDLRTLYKRRSGLMHGTYSVKSVYEGTYVTTEEIERWSQLIQQGVLRFFTLFLRGKRSKNDLDQVRNELLMSSLDPTLANVLQRLSDIDIFLEENGH